MEPGSEASVVVQYGTPAYGNAGYTAYGEPTIVTVLPDDNPHLEYIVCVHELLHAAGLEEHLPDEECYMSDLYWRRIRTYDGEIVPLPLCPEEYALLEAGGPRTYNVRCADPELWPAVRDAVDFLNEYGPFPLFLLEESP